MTESKYAPVMFGEVATQLHRLGWRPIPLRSDTKVPTSLGWNRLNRESWTDLETSTMADRFADSACGIAIPSSIYVVDIDVMDKDVSAGVRDITEYHFGITPLIRIGQAPKQVLIYRSDGTTQSKKPHPIEHFSGTGQVAVYGIHSKTLQPYQWPVLDLLELASDSSEIPLVTGDMQRAFLAATAHITTPRNPRVGRAAPGRAAMEPNDPSHYMRELLRRGLSFQQAARQILMLAQIGQRHSCIRSVVSAGFNKGMTAEQIERFISRHAPEETLEAVEQDGYLDRVIRDFTPKTFREII